MKKHAIKKSQASLDSFTKTARTENIIKYIEDLTDTKLKIIQLLDTGLYPAAIAKRLKLSRSYVSRFVQELKHKGCISVDFKNPITHVSTSYRLSEELHIVIEKLNRKKVNSNLTLCIPHKTRFGFTIEGKTKAYSLNTKRFAASKVKFVRSWDMRGGKRYLFEYNHPIAGVIGITAHPNSIEVYQRDRHHILAVSIEEATNILSMAISTTAERFASEQDWDNCHFTVTNPRIIGSQHYAFPSKQARKLTNSGHTQEEMGDGFSVDKSLEAKLGEKETAEIECEDFDVANRVDKGLRIAADIENIIPTLIQKELKSVSESILGINTQADKIDLICNGVNALVLGGMPKDMRVEQLMNVVAKQGETINLMQKTMLQIVENMSKILAKMGTGS